MSGKKPLEEPVPSPMEPKGPGPVIRRSARVAAAARFEGSPGGNLRAGANAITAAQRKIISGAAKGMKVVNKPDVSQVTNAFTALEIDGGRRKMSASSSSTGTSVPSASRVAVVSPFERPSSSTSTSLPMEMVALLSNFDATSCQFCTDSLKPNEGVMLQECLHVYCKACLEGAILGQKEIVRIPCPVADVENCGGFLLDAEVKLLVSPEHFQAYLDRSLEIAKKRMKNVFNCKTAGCSNWCEFEVGRKTFDCPSCKQTNCMQCQAIHPGLDCVTFRTLTPAQVKEQLEREKKTGLQQIKAIQAAYGDSAMGDIIEETDLLLNIMEFECAICLGDIDPNDGVILHECLHLFCKECLIQLVEQNDEATVKCPYIDENYSCLWKLQPREIKALVSPELYEKHLQRSVKLGESSDPNSFHCKTPDCLGWCINDENAEHFLCPICDQRNCIKCNVIHEGSCEDYQNRIKLNANEKLSEEAIEELIKKGEFMQCPNCRIPLQKKIGCDYLICTACRVDICWVTRGPRWGPKGKGDISGGCRCNVNGKKCHPNCGNCH